MKSILCLFLFLLLHWNTADAEPRGRSGLPGASTCTYSTWSWNSEKKRAEGRRTIRKRYLDIDSAEKGLFPGCSVCQEDQADIAIPGVPPFKVCKRHAEEVERAVRQIQAEGFPLRSVVGYRVGRSKGPLDSRGLRTQFSNHSFGTALDINSEQNGLYTDCFQFGPHCRLILGGAWDPGANGAINRASPAYRAFHTIGWHWGGELQGRQKDFMHFSRYGE